jgi:hypothetical protein
MLDNSVTRPRTGKIKPFGFMYRMIIVFIIGCWIYTDGLYSETAAQPAIPQAYRGMLWLGQDDRWPEQGPLRQPLEAGLSICADVCDLQTNPDAQLGAGVVLSATVSRGWSVHHPDFTADFLQSRRRHAKQGQVAKDQTEASRIPAVLNSLVECQPCQLPLQH